MKADSTRAPDGATTLTTNDDATETTAPNAPPVLWEASMQTFLAARIAEVEYDAAIFIPACDRYEATGERIPDDVSDKAEALTEVRCGAEKTLIFTPTNVLGNAIWKIAYARKRWEDFCDWPDDWWEAVFADLHRIDGAAEREPLSWEVARAAFDAKSAEIDATEASDEQLAEYWKLWDAAMLCPTDTIEAAKWKLGQFAYWTSECGEFAGDASEKYTTAIFADAARHARKGGVA